MTSYNLASLLSGELGDDEAALPLKEAVVAGFTKRYGPEAEFTLRSRNSLAVAYRRLKRHAEADR